MLGGAVLFTAALGCAILDTVRTRGRKRKRKQQQRDQQSADYSRPWHLLTILRLPIHWMPAGRLAHKDMVEFVHQTGVS